MEPVEQMHLGYAHMRAAIVGGHNLVGSWVELLSELTSNSNVYVIIGGLTCLWGALGAVDRAGLVPQDPPGHLASFLAATHEDRLKQITMALLVGDRDASALHAMAMISVVEPNKNRISFCGDLPSCY